MKNNLLLFLVFFLCITVNAQNEKKITPPKEFNKKNNTMCSRAILKEDPPSKKTSRTLAGCPASMAAWAGYSGNSLVQQLKSTTDYDSCLRSLFTFDESYGPTLFSNSNIDAVAKAMYAISNSHDGTLSSGMLGLTAYLHAATYHDFFQTSITFDANSKLQYEYAVEAFSKNTHLWDTTTDALMILDEYIILCDYDGIRDKPFVISVMKTAMKKLTVNNNWNAISSDSQLMQKYVTAYNRMFFLMFRGIQPVDQLFEASLNNDNEFFTLLSNLAKDTAIKNNEVLLLLSDNAVGEMSRMITSTVLKPKVEPYLADIVKGLPRLTPNWYRISKAINEGGNCAKYNLCENMTAVRAEIDKMLFPNTFVFDDGKLVVRTPLSYETILPLYYATKQVQSQVFRFLETDNPVTNDPNANLNMVLYGTMDNYHDWQSLLNNLDTNNGGMYIEDGATFYTYERTAAESTFSLEELFRHEYVHYLQGRYMVNGSWGSSPIYNNNRLVWFEEGMAEHFAGSTDSEGVTIRESQGSAIKNEGASEYMSVNDILSADYNNGFKFYRYSNMLWAYWFKNDMNTAREIVQIVKADDIAAYDAKINQLKTNSRLQTSYVSYLNNTVINPTNWWSVHTPWQNDKLYTIGNPTDIQAEFTTLTGKTGTAELEASNSLNRFKITGTLTGGNFDASLNTLIKKLNTSTTVNNFKYVTAYYKNVSATNATYIITGPLRNATVSDSVEPLFSTQTQATITGGKVKFNSQSTGYITGYSWSFPGGIPAASTEAEPLVTYNNPGAYTVQLTVSGKNNSSKTIEKSNYITIYQKPNINYCPATVEYNYTSITNVSFSNINNDSQGFPLNGYSDFSNLLAELIIGQSQKLEVSPELAWANNHVNVWIDWNQNGLFTDPGENVLNQSGTSITTNVTVPSNATLGVTRMRVRYSYDKTSESCGPDSYMGEVEDYSVLVKSNSQPITIATPTNLIATANSTTMQTSLTWTDNATNETTYTVERALGSGSYAIVATLAANVTSYTDTGLVAGNTYSYRIRANAASNYSNYSTITSVSFTTLDVNPPSNLVAVANTTLLQATLTWKDKATNEKGYVVERANGTDAFVNITTLVPNSTSYVDNGLTPETDYSYRVRASELVNPTYSNVAIINIPNSITLVMPKNIGNAGIYSTGFYASWDLVTDATSYEVQSYKTNTLWTTVATSSNYYAWIAKVDSDTYYRIRVRAVNTSGASEWSSFVDITLPNASKLGLNTKEIIGMEEGIIKPTQEKKFDLYPNPTSSEVNFSLQNIDISTATITIYNQSGIIIDTISKTTNYSVRHLVKGIYLIKITDGKYSEVKKLVIK